MLEDTSFSVTKRFLEQHGVDTNKSSEIAGAIYLLGGTPKDIYANKDSFVRFKNKPEYVERDQRGNSDHYRRACSLGIK